MKVNYKGKVDFSHYDIVLAESLVDQQGNFYDLTLQQNLNEILAIGKEELLCADYEVDLQKSLAMTKLTRFIGWTETKVIFLNQGIGVFDALLDWVPRNYDNMVHV